MKTGIFCIKDTKVGFMAPYCCPNEAVAVRDFTYVINEDVGKAVSINYTDEELYCLGTFDTDTGEITPEVRYICKGPDVKRYGDEK